MEDLGLGITVVALLGSMYAATSRPQLIAVFVLPLLAVAGVLFLVQYPR